MHVGGAAHAHIIGLTCGLYGPRACLRADVRVRGSRCEMTGLDMASGPRVPRPGSVGQVARLSETAIAFAGEKWVFLVQFSGAEVMRVSMSPCCRASCATFFALLGLMVGVSAKKFAQHTKNGPKLAFCGVLGELFRGNAAGGAVQGEFFRGLAAVGPRRASLLRRVPGSRTPLLAVLTLQCAAKPTWWPMGSTAHAPLGGLTCA